MVAPHSTVNGWVMGCVAALVVALTVHVRGTFVPHLHVWLVVHNSSSYT